MPGPESSDRLQAVSLFPLPNVVLFPRAILPLHIFEQRYKAMTRDALQGDRQIAMALLKPGWEKQYHDRPEIEPIVCVGSILTHELLPDGNYNLLLQGTLRARIVREHSRGSGEEYRPYRTALLEPLAEQAVHEMDVTPMRDQLIEMFTRDVFAQTGLANQFLQMLSSDWPTAAVADLLAFSYLDDVSVKQALLGEPNPLARVQRTIHELDRLRPRLRPKTRGVQPPSLN